MPGRALQHLVPSLGDPPDQGSSPAGLTCPHSKRTDTVLGASFSKTIEGRWLMELTRMWLQPGS